MAFAVHINIGHCTGCNNCVVACPVDSREIFFLIPASDTVAEVQ